MNSRIGTGGWIVLYVTAGIIDLLQFLIGFFGVLLSEIAIGLVLIAINEYADPFIGAAIAIQFQLRGVSMFSNWKRMASLLCVTGIDELTGGMASLWILDIWYIHSDVRKEKAMADAQKREQELLSSASRQALNRDGVRKPTPQLRQETRPANIDGVRPPQNPGPQAQLEARAKEEEEEAPAGSLVSAANDSAALAA